MKFTDIPREPSCSTEQEELHIITLEEIDAIDWHEVHLYVLAHRARKNRNK